MANRRYNKPGFTVERALPDLRQHLQTAISTLRASESTRARQLEHQLLVAHRELSALQNNFLDLGLQASLYARERDAARDRLRRTEQYLDSSLSDGDTRRVETHSVGGPCFPDARTGRSDIKPINWFIPGDTAREPLINPCSVIPANAGIQCFQCHGFRHSPEYPKRYAGQALTN